MKKIVAELLALLWKFARKVLWKWLRARIVKLGVVALFLGVLATAVAVLLLGRC